MNQSVMSPVLIVAVLCSVLLLLGVIFNCIKPCARLASLCQFLCLGIIVGCAAGVIGEFAYDFVERWLLRVLPGRSLVRLIDVIWDAGYGRYLGMILGAGVALWFWSVQQSGKTPHL